MFALESCKVQGKAAWESQGKLGIFFRAGCWEPCEILYINYFIRVINNALILPLQSVVFDSLTWIGRNYMHLMTVQLEVGLVDV